MKKILFSISFILTSIYAKAQSYPSMDFYQYDIGDEFHEEKILKNSTIDIYNLENRTVIDKIIYTDSIDYIFEVYTELVSNGSSSISIDTSTHRVRVSDTIKDDFAPCTSSSSDYDPTCSGALGFSVCYNSDTITYDSINTCLDTVYSFKSQSGYYCHDFNGYANYDLIGASYIKGVGKTAYYNEIKTPTDTTFSNGKIFYYKKINGGTCGIPNIVGVNEKKKLQFEIYPNPSNGQINIEGEISSNEAIIEILSLDGRIFYKSLFKKNLKLDIENGIYLLRIKNNNKIGIKRIIIES